MAIATLIDYKELLGTPPELLPVTCSTLATVVGRTYDLWTTAAPVGVAPTTAVVPTRATTGALGQQNGGAGILSILASRFNAMNSGSYMICDRLSHQGGLSGTAAGAQTTNLPTAALTRYTSGVGVMIGLTVYTQIGATTSSVTASYTNQAGASGQITPAVVIGNTAFREAGRTFILPLAAGDTGVQAVASVTLSGTTGTVGNFGVTLFKPIYTIIADNVSGLVQGGFISGNTFGGIPEIVDDACLYPICLSAGVNSAGCGTLLIAEH